MIPKLEISRSNTNTPALSGIPSWLRGGIEHQHFIFIELT